MGTHTQVVYVISLFNQYIHTIVTYTSALTQLRAENPGIHIIEIEICNPILGGPTILVHFDTPHHKYTQHQLLLYTE